MTLTLLFRSFTLPTTVAIGVLVFIACTALSSTSSSGGKVRSLRQCEYCKADITRFKDFPVAIGQPSTDAKHTRSVTACVVWALQQHGRKCSFVYFKKSSTGDSLCWPAGDEKTGVGNAFPGWSFQDVCPIEVYARITKGGRDDACETDRRHGGKQGQGHGGGKKGGQGNKGTNNNKLPCS